MFTSLVLIALTSLATFKGAESSNKFLNEIEVFVSFGSSSFLSDPSFKSIVGFIPSNYKICEDYTEKGPCEAETGTFGNEITECKWANGECTPTGNRPPSGNALQVPPTKMEDSASIKIYDLNGKADYVRFEFAESNKLKDLGGNFSIISW